MKHNNLLSIWNQQKIATNAWLTIPHAWTAEIIAHTGFDACTIDLQHGLADYQTAVSMLQAISTSETVPLVRVPWNEPILIMRMLDAGAYGVIAPMINNVQETKVFVESCKYPPIGSRSYGPIRASLSYGNDYFQEANNDVLAIAMRETKEGLANVEEIASVEGLNGFYIGTIDLSISLGIKSLGDLHNEQLLSAIKSIVAAAKKHNLMVGVHTKSAEETEILRKIGVSLLTPMTDSNLLKTNAELILDQIRKSLT